MRDDDLPFHTPITIKISLFSFSVYEKEKTEILNEYSLIVNKTDMASAI